jgi:hypothetical protein
MIATTDIDFKRELQPCAKTVQSFVGITIKLDYELLLTFNRHRFVTLDAAKKD